MANAGPNTNGSQFFICHQDLTGRLPKNYTIFGQVTKGLDIVDKIASAPRNARDLPDQPVAMTSVEVPRRTDPRARPRPGGQPRPRRMASAERSMSASVVDQFETGDRASRPGRATSCRPASTCRRLHAAITRRCVGRRRRASTSTWFSTTSLRISTPVVSQPVGEPARERAAALDQLGEPARPSERSAA